MNTVRSLIVTLTLAVGIYAGAVSWEPAFAQSHGDVFHAEDILPRESLEGPNYRVANIVSVKEHKYVFTIDSDFGQIEAEGRDMLDLRLRELRSIEAAKELAKDPHLVNGILTPLENTGKGFKLLVNQPLETIESLPKGFGLMVSQWLDPADRNAGSLQRRKLATELDCDPETRNPILKKLLDDMSLEYGGGGLLTQTAMIFIPGLSLIPMTAETKQMIANNPPHVINDQIEKKLEAAGVDKSVRSRFCKSQAFTTVQRLLLMEQFDALAAVSERSSLIEAATYAESESEALAAIRAGKMIVELSKKQAIRALTFEGLPMAVLEDHTSAIIYPYDYITNTEGLIVAVRAYRMSRPEVKTVLVITGDASRAARKTLEGAQIMIVEQKLVNK